MRHRAWELCVVGGLTLAGCGGGGGGGANDTGVPQDVAMDAGMDVAVDTGGGVNSDWFEVTDLHQFGPTFTGIASATTATQGGGIEVTFPFVANAGYLFYVRPDSGTYDFGHVHAAAGYRDTFFLGGLTPGNRYCVVVRALVGGVEDGNTNELCAVAGATPTPPTPTFPAFATVTPWTDTAMQLSVNVRIAAGLRYDLERSIGGGAFTTVYSKTLYIASAPLDYMLVFEDQPDVAGNYVYRVRTFADGVDVGVSADLPIAIGSRPWHSALEYRPYTSSYLPTPTLAVQSDGTLAVNQYGSGAAVDSFLTTPTLGSLREGANVNGDATVWPRIRCMIDDGRWAGGSNTTIGAYAKAADGTIFAIERGNAGGLSRLYHVRSTGCAEIATTAVHGSATQMAAHPSDPATLALVNGRGAWITRDGGVTFRLFAGGTARAVAFAPDGTLYFADQWTLVRSTDYETFHVYATWPDMNDIPREMAISPTGQMAVVGTGAITQVTPGVYVGNAGSSLTFENLNLADFSRAGLTYLSDGRLLALMSRLSIPNSSDEQRVAIRSTSGTWTSVEIPGPWKVTGPGAPVIFDERVGHEGDLYHRSLRSRDGGATWGFTPAGSVITGTTSGSTFVLLLATPTGYGRSTDGGDTAVASATPPANDGRIWWNQGTPLFGVGGGMRTVDGGATWTGSTGGLDWSGVGFVSATEAYATTVATATPPRHSVDTAATWSTYGAVNAGMACGNGTTALVSTFTSGMYGIQVLTAGGGVTQVLGLLNNRACGLSADGMQVYLLNAGGIQYSSTGPAGPYTTLLGSPGSTNPGKLYVSPDGMRLSFMGSWSTTGAR